MQPDQNEYPIDYLDQIATAPRSSGPINKWVMIIGIAIFLILIAIIVSLMQSSAGRTTPTKDMQSLYIKLDNIQQLANDSQSTLQNNKLRTANSNLSIVLSDANREMSSQLERQGIKTEKISESISLAESLEALSLHLEDARLNSNFDSIYQREINLLLTESTTLISRIQSKTKDKDLHSLTVSLLKNLKSIQGQFSEITAP